MWPLAVPGMACSRCSVMTSAGLSGPSSANNSTRTAASGTSPPKTGTEKRHRPSAALDLGHRQVGLFDVFANHARAAERRRQRRHAPANTRQPRARQPVRVAIVELRDDSLLEGIVQARRVALVDFRGIAAPPIADRPADVGLVGLVPPAVENRAV